MPGIPLLIISLALIIFILFPFSSNQLPGLGQKAFILAIIFSASSIFFSFKKEIIGEVVGFNKEETSEAVNLVCNLTGDNAKDTMSFGTEAGLFQNSGISTVICGPGSIEQAHTVDEYITFDQLKKCLKMLISLKEKMAN